MTRPPSATHAVIAQGSTATRFLPGRRARAAAGTASSSSERVTRPDVGQVVRRPTWVHRDARQDARGDERLPRPRRLAALLGKGVDPLLQFLHLIQRVELQQLEASRLPPAIVRRRLVQLAPEKPGGTAVSAARERRGRHRSQPPGGARDIGGPVEVLRRLRVVVQVPVIHEPDVVHVLPLPGRLAEALFEERNRQIRASGSRPAAAQLRKMAPNLYAMLKRGSSVVVRSSSGYRSSYRDGSRARAPAAGAAVRLILVARNAESRESSTGPRPARGSRWSSGGAHSPT